MKTAKSLVYGGELIEAIDCTYEDFKRLAPLCPNCSSPVHLKAGGDRTSTKGKSYKIPQHWAHFAGKSAEEVAACELRVNGYSDEEKEKIQRVAKGQREKWIRRWLWRAFEGWADRRACNMEVRATRGSSEVLQVKNLKELLSLFSLNSDRLKSSDGCRLAIEAFRSSRMTGELTEGWSALASIRAVTELQSFENSEWKGIDVGLQGKYTKEVLLHLKSPRQKELLVDLLLATHIVDPLIYLELLREATNDPTLTMAQVPSKTRPEDCWDAMALTLVYICLVIPWASEFARLEAENAAIGSDEIMGEIDNAAIERAEAKRKRKQGRGNPPKFARLEALEAVKAPHA
jgi:hypothetical protein